MRAIESLSRPALRWTRRAIESLLKVSNRELVGRPAASNRELVETGFELVEVSNRELVETGIRAGRGEQSRAC